MNNNLIDNRQIRVFISSTFRDMQGERDYLMKHTFPVLRTLASKRDVTLTELDLRWGITEEESKSGKVVEICLREIENSIPFFIGIIGNRYGWVPEKKDISENVTDRFKDVNTYLERRLSVTEMEMQFGVLQREEDMHAYFYIKDGEEVDNPDNPEMLERLKREVKTSRYPSSIYSSPEDLGIQVQEAFTSLLDQLFPEGHLSPLEKERVGQRSFMNQLCQNYIRDDKNFKVLDEWLANWERHQLVVTGASGLGKSALIANWLKEKLSDESRGYNIIYHFTGNGGSESSHEHIMKVLSDEINDVYGWETEEKDESSKSQKDKLNDLFLKVASEGEKALLIIIDAINQITDTDNAKLLNWLPIPPKNIKILFSTLEDDRTMKVFKNRHYPTFILEPISLEHRRQLITKYLGWFSKKLTNEQVERIANDRQCENTLVLKTLLDELINFGVYEKLDDRIEYYLSQDTIEEFYQALLKRFEEDFGEDFVKYILSLIAVSRNGLSQDEILAITGYKQLHWSHFYCAFTSHLTVKNGLISFSHRYVLDAISKRYLDDTCWEHSCRMAIIGELAKENNERAYAELPYQYDAVGDFDSLYQQLLNLDVFYFQYKHLRYQLVSYWRDLFDNGYDCAIYNEKLKKANYPDKRYGNISKFFRVNFSLDDFSLTLLENLLELQKSILGEDTPDTADLYKKIGLLYTQEKDYDKALEYYFKAVKVCEVVHGVNYFDTADSCEHIVFLYSRKGEHDKALEYRLKTLKIRESILVENSRETAISYDNISFFYSRKRDFAKALKYKLKAVKIREYVLGNNSLETAYAYRTTGYLYSRELRDYEKALKYHLKEMKIYESILGENHFETTVSYNDIGNVYYSKGDSDKALEYYLKAVKIRESMFGENHSKTVGLYSNIGNVYRSKGDYNKVLEYYLKIVKIRESMFGEGHPKTAVSYNNIAWTFHLLCRYEEALPWAERAVKSVPNNVEYIDTLATIYQGLGRYDEALEQFELCLRLKKEQRATEESIQETEKKIAAVNEKMKEQ